MSAAAWAGVAALVVLALATWWALRRGGAERPAPSDVDPATLPVGTYWWAISREGRVSWEWRAYRKTEHLDAGGQPYTYNDPLHTGMGTMRATRWGAERAVRRAIATDRRLDRYAAQQYRGAIKP